MGIRRLTIDLDDLPDNRGSTELPEGLRVGPAEARKPLEITSVPDADEADDTISPTGGKVPPRSFGRTWGDLLAELINDPRVVACTLLFLPFLVYVPKIAGAKDLLVPLLVGSVLNLAWFIGGRVLRRR